MISLENIKDRPIASLGIAAQAYFAITAGRVWIWPDSLPVDDLPNFAGMATVNCIIIAMLLASDIFKRQ